MTNNPFFLADFNPANYAIQLLNDTLGFEKLPVDIFSIPEFLEEKNVYVYFNSEKFENTSEYGLSEISQAAKTIFLNASFYGESFEEVNLDPLKRKHCRFTLAHELGHCTIPSHINVGLQQNLTNDNNVHARKYSFQKEYEANIFAAELLIPSATVKNIYCYGKCCKEMAENLSKKYDTSFLASMLKIAELCRDSICICLQISAETKTVINLKYSDEFKNYGKGLFIKRGDDIYSGSLANALTKRDYPFNYQLYKDPSGWFPDFRGNSEASLHEWSFKMGDNIITFLELVDTSIYSLHL